MANYKKTIKLAKDRFTENDVIIGAKLALEMPEDIKRIDRITLQQSLKTTDYTLYGENGTPYQDFWSKIKKFEPPEQAMKLFATAIKEYLWEIYREYYEA